MTDDVRGSPADRVAKACARWGDDEVVCRLAALLRHRPGDPVTRDLLDLAIVLGGLTDRDWLAGGKPPGHSYWARVWAARALRYVWAESASSTVIHGLDDEHWRVREMSANVVRDHEIPDAAERLVSLTGDEVPRVRKAAALALGVVGEGEHADAIRELVDDPEPAVAGAAANALAAMSRRLDRTF